MSGRTASGSMLGLFLVTAALLLLIRPAGAATANVPRWETLPPVAKLAAPLRSGRAAIDGIRMYYAVFGQGPAILLIHNGLGSADDWGGVVPRLAREHTVIVADTRGFGRSSLGAQPLSYPLFASDYVALLRFLHAPPVYLVGTSDGGIIGLDIAIHHPDLLSGLFVQGANTNAEGIQPHPRDLAAVRLALQRSRSEYLRLSPTPDGYARFRAAYNAMPQPDYTAAQLAAIRVPTTVAIADHDESIKRSHSEFIAAAIPHARMVVLKDVSHFASMQDPAGFADAVEKAIAAAHGRGVPRG